MNPISLVHRRLGAAKALVVDKWPYLHRMKAMPKIRDYYRSLLKNLPALPPNKEARFELHMLCGNRDADMGMWASWSIMRFLDGRARLYVHSDGTLTEDDIDLWLKVIGRMGLSVISREEGDLKVEQALALRTLHLFSWRSSRVDGPQVVDAHFFGDLPQLLILDSDVLTFSCPQEVIDALTAQSPSMAWDRDLRDAYMASTDILHQITGVHVPHHLNCGFLVTPRLSTDDFLLLDHEMEKINKDPRVSIDHYWSGQTYYALIASRFPNSREFSTAYAITKNVTKEDQVVRHYVGIPKVRFRYFTEGLPRIVKQAGIHPLN